MNFGKLEDLHCHSSLSSCCTDPGMTPKAILAHADKEAYGAVCITDHLWDKKIPGASPWYTAQDLDHVCSSRPLPTGNVPFYFGCETELPVNGIPALAKENFDLFDFVVIPVNHMHMAGLVRPPGIDSPEKMARLIEDRLENLLLLDLPFQKIGLAHLTGHLMYTEGSVADVIRAMDEQRLLRIFSGYAKAGTGIELNAQSFPQWDTRKADLLKIYQGAKEAGCLFYLASDAHTVPEMDTVSTMLPHVIEALGLTAHHRYHIL